LISPLVYVFAAAGAAVVLLFGGSALLTLRHAQTRTRRAGDLRDYIAGGLPPPQEERHEPGKNEALDDPVARRGDPVAERFEQRAKVMHVTIGDLIRDTKLAAAATKGAVEAHERVAARLVALRRGDSRPGESH
jgi:hypothetical protein